MSATTKLPAAGTHVASALLPATRPRGDLARKVLACLASGPKSRAEIRGIVGGYTWDVYKAVDKLVRTGAAAEIGKGRYAAVPGAQERIGDHARLSRMIPGVPYRPPAHRRGRPAHWCAAWHRAEPGGCADLHRAGCQDQPGALRRHRTAVCRAQRAGSACSRALQRAAAADPRCDPGLPERAAAGAGRRSPHRPAGVDCHGPPRGDAAARVGAAHRAWPVRAGGHRQRSARCARRERHRSGIM